ncbi:MAG: hypothetical protein FJZ47_22165, partial [Candidatus Tectomicrobia bacterium]|nr:hypothetical protein [Candidatus Tectomicrobia bacterium]
MKHRAGFYLRLVGTLAWYAGLLLLCASPVRAEVRYVYDEVGRLIQVTNPAGESAYYHYDAAGNLLSITRSTVGELAIAEVTPDQGVVGTRVTIAGAGFSTAVSANRVTFNGVSATVLSATATTLVTTVPQGASTGGLTVTIGAQTVSSATRFTVTSTALDAAPTIGSFLPQIALPGALVSIVGKHFARPPGNNIVSFNLTQAPVDSGTTGRLNTTVPTGATSGPLKVRTPTGTALSSTDFFVVPAGFTA